jgi:predicted transcriptional regulator
MVKKLTAVRIKEKTLAELSKIAKREDEKLSEVIRRALEDFVRREAKRKAK